MNHEGANARSGNCERPRSFGSKLIKYTAAGLVALTVAGILPALAKAGLDALTAGMPEWAQFALLFGGFAALAVWLGFKAGNAIEGR